jgi:hypothetical protein
LETVNDFSLGYDGSLFTISNTSDLDLGRTIGKYMSSIPSPTLYDIEKRSSNPM